MIETPLEGIDARGEFRTINVGSALQRLFSTFPDRWPGFGLLLLRLSLSSHLIFIAFSGLSDTTAQPAAVAANLAAGAGAIFLLAGLWTPIIGALTSVDEVWIALWLHSPGQEHTWIHICLAVICASVAMLGPGAWSIDARMYGRRRFPKRSNRGTKPSS